MTSRRPRASRRWATAACVLVAVGVVGLGFAGAAQLAVTSGGVFAGSESRCASGPVAITGGAAHTGISYTSVNLASLDPACSGRAVDVTLFDAAGVALATGTGTAGAAPFDITTTAYNATAVAGAAMLVATWGVPATWTPPPYVPFTCVATNGTWVPIVPAVNCTITNLSVVLGTSGGYATATISFRVGNLGGYNRFIITANFASVPTFPGWTPVRVWRRVLRADPTYSCTQLPVVSVRGRTTDGPTYYLFETLNPVNLNPGGYTRICP